MPCTPTEVIRALLRAGFHLDHTTGPHRFFRHSTKPGLVVVPFHHRDPKRGTLNSILKQAGLSADGFVSLLYMPNVETLATARMTATRIKAADFDDLLLLNQDPEVAKTMAGVRTDAETHEFIRSSIEHWERHGFGFWIFRDRVDGRFIGRAGIHHVEIDGAPEIEIAYAVMPAFWRRGFATEMARKILEVAATLGIRDMVAFTLPTNLGSRGVMEKVGFRYERDITWANLPHALYRRKQT